VKFSGGLLGCNLDAKPDSIWDILQERSSLLGEKTFLNFIDLQQTLTYRETADRSGAIGLGLREHGIKIGARVGLLLSSSPLHVLAWFSTIGAAMVDVPINPDFRGEVLDHAIHKIEVTAVFADDVGLGLTRFYEVADSLAPVEDSSSLSRDFTATFDDSNTKFDKKFTFTIRARDSVNFATLNRTFSITVVAENSNTFANLYVKAFQTKPKRLAWYNFITDATIFQPDDLYRYGDPNFGVQTALQVLVYAGIESVEAVRYVQSMSRNHYRKRLQFGELGTAKAKDARTQETIYEVV
jgi:acyl-CoA synthetase (AMP-forming)/AMP-acid ligase II